MPDSSFEADTRKTYIDGAVRASAKMEYKLINLCTVQKSDSWTEQYYQRTNTIESTGGGTGSAVKGTPQMAPFAYVDQTFTLASGVNKIFGAESILSLKMIRASPISLLSEVLSTVARTVAYALDVAIEAVLSASAGNTFALTAGYEWDSDTTNNRDPIGDILYGIQMLRTDGIDALNGKGYFVTNGTDATNIMKNARLNNSPFFINKVAGNGVIGSICGLTWMLSEAVTADQAYIVATGDSLIFKENAPLTVATIEDPGQSIKIRAWLDGQVQLTAPNAVCKITNTRK